MKKLVFNFLLDLFLHRLFSLLFQDQVFFFEMLSKKTYKRKMDKVNSLI